jgi:hypothetical protein
MRSTKAAEHIVMAEAKGVEWDCSCKYCKKTREEGSELTQEEKLKAIYRLTTGSGLLPTFYKEGIDEATEQAMKRLCEQLASEEATIEKQKSEKLEKEFGKPTNALAQGSGGGRRIVRSGKPMS